MNHHRVVVLHAYDALNRGDGLLVTETLYLLSQAGIALEECCVVACNASSLEGDFEVVQYPVFGTRGTRRVRESMGIGVLALGGVVDARLAERTSVGNLVRHAELIVGVGGGYLRAEGGKASRLSGLVHLPQLALAARSQAPSVYMPQSIGPLGGPVGRSIGRHLQDIGLVMARDDTTMRELAWAGPVRFPDLAVLRIARADPDARGDGGPRVVGIARHLPLEGFVARLHHLDALLPIDWAAHSRAKGQDDELFYSKVGLRCVGNSEEVLARRSPGDVPGVVISVRLHGALQAIEAGVPAIHLSYERKGQGAFADLGIEPWLHHSKSFDPVTVAHQARALLADPSPYWAAIDQSSPQNKQRQEELVLQVRALSGSG